MNDIVTKSKNNRIFFAVLLGVLLFVISIGVGIYSYKLGRRTININAEITKVEYNATSNKATVKYKVNHKEYSKIVNTNSTKELTVSDKIPITYDRDNPDLLINNKYYPIISIACFFISILLLIVFLPKYVTKILRDKEIKQMKKDNVFIDIPISEIIVDNTLKPVQGIHAYKLRLNYNNPKNNQEYVYESDPCYVNLSKIIENTRINHAKIYLNKLNTNDYYVDLKTLYPDIPVINPNEVLSSRKATEVIAERFEEKKEEYEAKKKEDNNK